MFSQLSMTGAHDPLRKKFGGPEPSLERPLFMTVHRVQLVWPRGNAWNRKDGISLMCSIALQPHSFQF